MTIPLPAKAAFFSTALLAFSTSAFAEFDLTGIPYVAYGDGESYSLPISQTIDGCTGPGCDLYVKSTPGAIQDLIVVATGSSGTGVTTNIAGIDDAYATPNGKNSANFYETSDTSNDPGATNGSATTELDWAWDADITSLNSFSGGDDLIFFFNNNQINSCDSACQSLAIWAQLWITDASGALVDLNGSGTIGDAGDILEFTNQIPAGTPLPGGGVAPTNLSAPYALVPDGGGIPSAFGGAAENFTSDILDPATAEPFAGSNLSTDYVLSGGEICLDASFIPVPCGDPTQAFGPFEHNLGANEAAYAVIFPELNAYIAALADATGYTLHIDFNMGCDPSLGPNAGAVGDNVNDLICTGEDGGDLGRNINNGFEQIFIGTASTTTNVPSPATIMLLGLGLLGMGLIRRRQATV